MVRKDMSGTSSKSERLVPLKVTWTRTQCNPDADHFSHFDLQAGRWLLEFTQMRDDQIEKTASDGREDSVLTNNPLNKNTNTEIYPWLDRNSLPQGKI